MKSSILWISLCAPYDKVGHGGGKTHNFYLKQVKQSNQFDIELISFCDLEDYEIIKSDLASYSIKNTIIPWTHDITIKNLIRKAQLIDSKYNIFNEFGGATNNYYWDCIKKELKKLAYTPDIIILQWTEIVLFIDKIKQLFPVSKIVAIEEDVKFLSFSRKVNNCNSFFKSGILKKKYKKARESELRAIAKAELVITYSEKDKKLIYQKQSNILVLSPYFERYQCIRNVDKELSLLFYGAMSRQDNYDSVIWFIENVFYKLPIANKKFYIVGNRPASILEKYASNEIIITGYVDTPISYFEKCTCLVAPLVSGAGIKIKILEALAAGIPVLTNDIGIEGIDAQPGIDYIYCAKSQDYLCKLLDIINGKLDVEKITVNSRKLINNNYNLQKDSHTLINTLMNLSQK